MDAVESQPVPFSTYMATSLYGPNGFYTRGGGAGRRRDFVTSVEIGTLFGALIARRLDDTWDALGCPAEFAVYDVGAGPGTLARTVREAAPRCSQAMRYYSVDISEGMRALHLIDGRYDSLPALPTQEFAGVVIAHELLDNMPTEIAEYRNGRWWQVFVDVSEGQPVEELREPSDLFVDQCETLVKKPIEGGRIPIANEATTWVVEALRVIDPGALIVIDYGRPTTEDMMQTHPADFLRTYREHQRTHDPYVAPGQTDITIDVPFDQLALVTRPDRFARQADTLRSWGLDQLLAEAASTLETEGSSSMKGLKARSHLTEAKALTDPDGLGAFWIAEWLM
jgi:SAM-dependent MidA family methyltransferase